MSRESMYILIKNEEGLKIISKHGFSKKDKLKDFLNDNKNSKVRIIFG